MQGCKYEVYPWWCQRTYLNCNANVFSKRWRCKDLMVQMPSNGYVMMQMSFCRDAMMQMSPCLDAMMLMSLWCMPWCKCTLVEYVMTRMSSCRYAMNANATLCVYHDTSALMQTQFIQKFPLFKTRLPQCLEPKYSQNLIYYSWKVIFLLT